MKSLVVITCLWISQTTLAGTDFGKQVLLTEIIYQESEVLTVQSVSQQQLLTELLSPTKTIQNQSHKIYQSWLRQQADAKSLGQWLPTIYPILAYPCQQQNEATCKRLTELAKLIAPQPAGLGTESWQQLGSLRLGPLDSAQPYLQAALLLAKKAYSQSLLTLYRQISIDPKAAVPYERVQRLFSHRERAAGNVAIRD